MKQIVFIAVVLLCYAIPSASQHAPAELERKLAGKKKLQEIMAEIDKYYKAEEEEKEREKQRKKIHTGNAGAEEVEFEGGPLKWKRWEYFNKTRLKPNGELEDVNAKTFAAFQKTIAKYGDGRQPTGTNIVESGSNAAWSFIGPFNLQHQGGIYRGLCRIDKIVFHPTDANTIFAGANNGGIWRTQDGGNTWTNLNFYFPLQSASGIAVNPNNPNNIFVLTGDGNGGGAVVQNSVGIWVTNDAGGNWFKTNFNSDRQTTAFNGFKLVIMPQLTYIMFAATQSGLYRSQDAGMNWTQVIAATIYDVEFDPAQPGRVYASGNGRFYMSENYGSAGSFSNQTGIAGATRIEIGVSPNNPNYVYLLCGPYTGGTGSNTFQGLYRSTTGGTSNSFVQRTNTPNILCWATSGIKYSANDGDQSSYDLAIDVSPYNAELVVAGGKNVWRSTTGGTAMQNLTVFNEDSGLAKYIHPDVHEIAFNPLNGWLYAGTDGGIYRSTNNGVNWTNLTNGIHTTTFYHMAGAPFDVNRVIGGTQDNGVKYKSNAGDFTHITGADGYDGAFGPSAASNIYTTVNASVLRFDINGNTQTNITPANTSFFPVIAADPVTNNTIYLAAGTPGVMKSTNGGGSWSQVLNQTVKQSIITCPNNANRVYVCGTGSIFRTDNGGTNWTGNLAANPGFINNGQISDINVCSGNSDYVYVTLGGYTAGQKVMYSNDAGANWFSISSTLPAEVKVNCVVVDQGNNSYIGTDMGVFYQAVTSNDWTPYYNQMPRVPVTDLAINQGASRIRAATYGHGIWETALFTPCDVNFSLTGGIAGTQFYQASNILSSTASIVGGNQTSVTVRAGGEVYLAPDFTVYEGNVFNAILGACNSSPVPGAANRAEDIPPVFLSQVEKGNDTTLYPYGYITVNKTQNGTTSVSLNTVQTGDFLIIVTDKNGVEELFRFNENMTGPATLSKPLPVSSFLKGKYFVQLYFNGKLVHVQELIVN
ncbi:MAG: 3-coathanger stack domain-containing protein [Bacteroidota bacterium]